MTSATEEGKSLRAICVHKETGRVLQDVEVLHQEDPLKINPKNSYASPTPVLEPGRLYVHFGAFGSGCVDTKSGDVLWTTRELELDHKEGPGGSPIIHGNLLIVNCDGIDVQYVAALDKQTGKLAWKTSRPSDLNANPDFRKAYSTPLVIHADGKDQLLSPGADYLIAYDPATGAELWKIHYQGFSTVPRPVFDGQKIYFCTGYMKPQLWSALPVGDGDITTSGVAWKYSNQVPANSSPVLVGGELYMVSDQGILACVDTKTGEARWRERIGGNFSASPIHGAGRLYFWDEDGKTTVIKPGPSFEVLAKNEIDGRIMATPAIVGNAIYLRSNTHLYRIEDRSAAVTAGGE
jgi:outer membrane protein assembly factor BamB